MTFIIVGKNSSIFKKIRSKLSLDAELVTLKSLEALSFDFNNLSHLRDKTFVIFSGVVSSNKDDLLLLENFHSVLSEKLKTLGTNRIILISSSAVYGDYKENFSEADQCLPTNTYGLSKLKIENIYLRSLDDRLTVLRLGNVIGLDGVSKSFRNLASHKRMLDCYNDLSTPLRTYVDTSILVKALLTVYKINDYRLILNVGRMYPQEMSSLLDEQNINYELRISPMKLSNITLDTSQLFKLIEGASL